ncbi:MAG: LysR family transcriptional regulator [Pseudomonadota bacterium]
MSKPLDRLTLLETFVRIAEAGSISAAARDLGLSQPSASRQLSELETRFQTQLAHRTTHTLTLTSAGQGLLADARTLIGQWQALEERHLKSATDLQGPIKVVAPVALGQTALTRIAACFQEAHPGVHIEWLLDDAPIRFSEIGCDCWIRVGSVPDDTLVVRQLGRVSRLLVAAPSLLRQGSNRRRPDSVATTALIALSPYEAGAIPLHRGNQPPVTISPPVRMQTNNIFALKASVLAGLGMGVMPHWFVDEDLKAGRLVDVLPAWRAPQLPIHIAYASDRYQSARLRAFIEVLTTRVPEISGIDAP